MTIAVPSEHFTRSAAVQTDRGRTTSLAVSTKPLASAAAADLSVHPAPIMIGLACCAWFLLISWVCFAPLDRETALMVGVVTIIFAMFLGGMTIGALYSSARAGGSVRRSFREFINGEVDTATGLISGREAMIQIAALPLTLAAGGTAMAVIWTLIR
jgi:hypothetical protein